MPEDGIVVVRVFKGNILKGNGSLRYAHFLRPGLVKDLHVRVHDLKKSLNAGESPLELLRKFDDPADGGDQRGHVHHIGYQVPGGDISLDEENAPHQDHGQVHQPVKGAGGSLECGHVFVSFLLDIVEFYISLFKLVNLHRLIGKCLHHLLAQKAVLNGSVQLPDLDPLFGEGPSAALVQFDAYIGHDRNDDKDRKGQRQVHGGEDHKGDHRLDRCNEKFLRAVVGKLRHIKQVVGDPPHDLPHLCIVVIGIGQLLQMGIGIPSHIRLDGGAHDVPHIRHIIIGHAVDDPQHQIEQGHLPYHVHTQHRQILHTGIGDKPDDHGKHHLAERGKKGTEQIRRKHPGVVFIIGIKPLHQFFGRIFFLIR